MLRLPALLLPDCSHHMAYGGCLAGKVVGQQDTILRFELQDQFDRLQRFEFTFGGPEQRFETNAVARNIVRSRQMMLTPCEQRLTVSAAGSGRDWR